MNPNHNFWKRVADRRAAIEKEMLMMPWQPKNRTAFVVALDTARVFLVTLDIAAKLIEERTHALASEQQVADFKAAEAKFKRSIRGADLIA